MPEKTLPQVSTTVGDDGSLKKRISNSTYKKYREMRRDPTIGLARRLVIAPILASEWSVEATALAPEGAKEFIAEVLLPLRLHILRTASLGNIDFGWQAYEKVLAQRADGMTYVGKLKPLLQDITDILVDPATGAFVGLFQEVQGKKTSLTVSESLLISLDVEGTDWYGQAMMDAAVEPYDQWRDVDDAADRYDRRVAGAHWVVYYPAGTSIIDGEEKDNFAIAKDILASLKAAGAVVVPVTVSDFVDDLSKSGPGWKIELLTQGGQQYSFVARLSYIDKLKVRALGLPERSVIEGEFGTKAESEAHANLALTNMELRHLIIVQHVNWHVVNQLLRINYGPEAENSVYIVPSPLTDVQRDWLQRLYTAIITNEQGFLAEYDSVDMQAVRDRLGVPEKMDEGIVPGDQYRSGWPTAEDSAATGG